MQCYYLNIEKTDYDCNGLNDLLIDIYKRMKEKALKEGVKCE